MARFIKLRVLRSSVGITQAQPYAQAVVARWNDIMNSSARAIEASTYSGPSTSRRIGIPFWNRASSSAISIFLLQTVARVIRLPVPQTAPKFSVVEKTRRQNEKLRPSGTIHIQKHTFIADVDIVLDAVLARRWTIRFAMLSIAGAAACPTNKRWRSSMLADELIDGRSAASRSHGFCGKGGQTVAAASPIVGVFR